MEIYQLVGVLFFISSGKTCHVNHIILVNVIFWKNTDSEAVVGRYPVKKMSLKISQNSH